MQFERRVESKGIQKGIKIGIEQGILATLRSTVIHMIQENLSIDVICRVAECDPSYVEKIQEELVISE